MHAKSLQSCPIPCNPITYEAPLSMGTSRQEYWSGLPCLPLGDLPNPGTEPVSHVSCITGRFFTTSTTWEVLNVWWKWKLLSHVRLFTTPLVHGILQTRILEWVALPFSRGSSQPRDRIQVSCIAGRFFTSWATREALNVWLLLLLSHFSCVRLYVTP